MQPSLEIARSKRCQNWIFTANSLGFVALQHQTNGLTGLHQIEKEWRFDRIPQTTKLRIKILH